MSLPLRAAPLTRLIDANPKWVYVAGASARSGISFDCPIHADCRIAVPFKNPPDGGPPARDWFPSGALWTLSDDSFPTLTLSPSIHVMGEPDGCEWHGFVRHGIFETCGDSR